MVEVLPVEGRARDILRSTFSNLSRSVSNSLFSGYTTKSPLLEQIVHLRSNLVLRHLLNEPRLRNTHGLGCYIQNRRGYVTQRNRIRATLKDFSCSLRACLRAFNGRDTTDRGRGLQRRFDNALYTLNGDTEGETCSYVDSGKELVSTLHRIKTCTSDLARQFLKGAQGVLAEDTFLTYFVGKTFKPDLELSRGELSCVVEDNTAIAFSICRDVFVNTNRRHSPNKSVDNVKATPEHTLLFTDNLHTVLGDLLSDLHVGCDTGFDSRVFVVVKRKTLLSDKLFIAKDVLTLNTVRGYFCRELVDRLTAFITTDEHIVKGVIRGIKNTGLSFLSRHIL